MGGSKDVGDPRQPQEGQAVRVLGSRYARDKGINGMVGHVHTRCDEDGLPMAVNVSGAFHYLTANELEVVEKNGKNAKKTRKKG